MPDDLFGILNLAKPANVTSRAVVDVVQRLVRPAKAGHAGTLDPLARGVVVVRGVGRTQRQDKRQETQRRQLLQRVQNLLQLSESRTRTSSAGFAA